LLIGASALPGLRGCNALTTGIYGAVSFFFLPHWIKSEGGKASRWLPALVSIWANKKFVAMFFSSFFGVFLFFHWGGAIALLIKDLGYPERVYGMLMAFNGFLITVAELPLSHWVKHFNARWVIGIGFRLCGVGVACCGFATSWLWIAIALIIFTVGEMISMPVSGAYGFATRTGRPERALQWRDRIDLALRPCHRAGIGNSALPDQRTSTVVGKPRLRRAFTFDFGRGETVG